MSRIACAICLAAALFGADGVQWRTWDAGLNEALQKGKLVMIDAVREGCDYCDNMEAAVFKDPVTAARIEHCVVPVKVNLSREGMPNGLHVPMTPSFYFLDGGDRLVKMVPGSWNREDFGSFLDDIPGCKPDDKEQRR